MQKLKEVLSILNVDILLVKFECNDNVYMCTAHRGFIDDAAYHFFFASNMHGKISETLQETETSRNDHFYHSP